MQDLLSPSYGWEVLRSKDALRRVLCIPHAAYRNLRIGSVPKGWFQVQ